MSHEIEIDQQQIKQQLKTFLKGKPQFSDYNFEGSNISALLDLLSYNTYLNNLYLNMAVNEMFLDTALTEDAVRSHSKELNYLPRSRRSAQGTVTLTINQINDTTSVLIPKGTSFTSSANNQSFTFTTAENNIATVNLVSNTVVTDLTVFEGAYKSEFFTVNSANTNQRFVIQDNKIDTRSLTVTVRNSASDTSNGTYTLATDLFNLTPTSNVFFLQADSEGKYEMIFGNGVTGRALENGNVVEANYRVSSGEGANGARIFSVGAVSGYSNTSVVLANSETFAQGGAVRESVDSIKFNAVRHYQTLQRAVTAEDYKNLLLAEFPELESLNVYGGEDETPPRFGRVVISADAANADGISNQLKERIREFVDTKSPVSIEADFVDAEFLEIEVVSDVRYNINVTTQSIADIRTKVQNAITTYSTTNLNDFDKTFRFSRLLAAIDGADASILGNSTSVRAIRTISPEIGVAASYSILFGNQLTPDNQPPTTAAFANYVPGLESGPFTKGGTTCYLQDDSNGNIDIVSFANNQRNIIEAGVGTVDYTTGLLSLASLTVDAYTGDGIKLYGRVATTRIQASKNLILQISSDDVTVNVIQERE